MFRFFHGSVVAASELGCSASLVESTPCILFRVSLRCASRTDHTSRLGRQFHPLVEVSTSRSLHIFSGLTPNHPAARERDLAPALIQLRVSWFRFSPSVSLGITGGVRGCSFRLRAVRVAVAPPAFRCLFSRVRAVYLFQ